MSIINSFYNIYSINEQTFAYSHVLNPNEIIVNVHWPGGYFGPGTHTALKYDQSFENVVSWGYPALYGRSYYSKTDTKPVENFLLYLSKMENKPPLPNGLDYKKVITDYLKEMGNLIKESLNELWYGLKFFENVLIIMPVLKYFL